MSEDSFEGGIDRLRLIDVGCHKSVSNIILHSQKKLMFSIKLNLIRIYIN